MVFYGIRSNTDFQFQQLQQEIALLNQQRQITNQNNLTLATFHREVGLSTVSNGLGNIITQSILSSKYVLSCIGEYFKREWTGPALRNLSPLIAQYDQLPITATQLKWNLAQSFPFQQRLTGVLLVTSAVFAHSLSTDVWRSVNGWGRVVAVFGGLSFVALPEVSLYVGKSLIFNLQ